MTPDKKITVVTGNPGKIASFRRYLEPLGFEVTHESLDLVEPQLDSIEEVALSKARQAHKILNRPLVVEDTGFYIGALDGFPGPYNKYFIEKLGVDGYLRLMEEKTDRNCKFFSVVVYIDDKGAEQVFTSGISGTLAQKPDDLPLKSDAKSSLWKIFIPEGGSKTLNELNEDERKAFFKASEDKSVASLFAQWLNGQKESAPRKHPDAPRRRA